jgi:hypothetical protein
MSIETTDEELGNKLFCDLKNDAEKANFFLSGRGYETGVIARAIQNDVAMTYHRCAVATTELHRQHALNVELLEVAKLALRMGVYGGVSPSTVEDAARAAIARAEGKV